MVKSSHQVNLLTFTHPEPVKLFGFKTIKLNGASPLRKGEYPKELWEAHRKELQETGCLYTDFESTQNCKYTAEVDLTQSLHFAKHYYNYQIYSYFKNVADLVFPNFVRQTEIWFQDQQQSTDEYRQYNKFTLTVQLALITNQPELVVAYNGTSRVLNRNVLELVSDNVDTRCFNWMVYRGELIRYEDLPADANNWLSEIYPVLNSDLADALHWPPSKPQRNGKKYRFYFEQIDQLLKNILNREDFRALIPHSGVWYTVKEEDVRITSNGSNLLKFGTGYETDPYEGLKKFKPCIPVPPGHYKFFFICHESDQETANTFHKYSQRRLGFINFSEFLSLPVTYDKDKHVIFRDLENPLPEIKEKLENTEFDPGIKWLAIYISPYNKYDPDPVKRNLYYQVKHVLLKYRVTSQVIFNKNILDESFKFSVANIAIAVLAKLGGIPWRLDREISSELIVGIGAFKTKKYNIRYLGSTFCFANDGTFQRFDSFPAEDLLSLAGSIREAVINYRNTNREAERLVIHFYKRMSNKEIAPIIRQLRSLQLDIPVVIVSVNKNESEDLILFDTDYENKMPLSGTYLAIGRDSYILCNNCRYPFVADETDDELTLEAKKSELKKRLKSYPLPVKVHLQSTDETILEDPEKVKELIDQVYQFSRMYWESVSQQNLPVTVKYPAMIAEMFPHLPGNDLWDFGKTNLWIL